MDAPFGGEHLIYALAAIGGLYLAVKTAKAISLRIHSAVEAYYNRVAGTTTAMIADKLPPTTWNTRFSVFLKPAPRAYKEAKRMGAFSFQMYVEPKVGDRISITRHRGGYTEDMWRGEYVVSAVHERSYNVYGEHAQVKNVHLCVEVVPSKEETSSG